MAEDWARPVVHAPAAGPGSSSTCKCATCASLARAVELGGTLVTEPFAVPGGPTLAAVDDPEGNPLVLVQQ